MCNELAFRERERERENEQLNILMASGAREIVLSSKLCQFILLTAINSHTYTVHLCTV